MPLDSDPNWRAFGPERTIRFQTSGQLSMPICWSRARQALVAAGAGREAGRRVEPARQGELHCCRKRPPDVRSQIEALVKCRKLAAAQGEELMDAAEIALGFIQGNATPWTRTR